MELFKEFISAYGTTILYSILTAVAGYIGIVVKNLYQKYINDKTKQDVAKTVVQAVEQIIRTYMVKRSSRRLWKPLLICFLPRALPLVILS